MAKVNNNNLPHYWRKITGRETCLINLDTTKLTVCKMHSCTNVIQSLAECLAPDGFDDLGQMCEVGAREKL